MSSASGTLEVPLRHPDEGELSAFGPKGPVLRADILTSVTDLGPISFKGWPKKQE